MKNFNKLTFVTISVLFVIIVIPGFLAAWAEDEGTLGTNIVWITFAKLFYLLRFPTHTLLWMFFYNGGAVIYFAGLFINCLFYGLITERIISFVKQRRPTSLR